MPPPLTEKLKTVMAAVTNNPLDKDNFLKLGEILYAAPRGERKDTFSPAIFSFLADILRKYPKDPVVYLNLAAFSTSMRRPDMARDFSGAAIKHGEKKLTERQMLVARSIFGVSKAQAHRSERTENYLITAARECGIEPLIS